MGIGNHPLLSIGHPGTENGLFRFYRSDDKNGLCGDQKERNHTEGEDGDNRPQCDFILAFHETEVKMA
jgi:hypothetical protein